MDRFISLRSFHSGLLDAASCECRARLSGLGDAAQHRRPWFEFVRRRNCWRLCGQNYLTRVNARSHLGNIGVNGWAIVLRRSGEWPDLSVAMAINGVASSHSERQRQKIMAELIVTHGSAV